MSRLLFVAAVVAVVYLLLKSLRGRTAAGKNTPGNGEDMVRCNYCGVHIPKGESMTANGKYYCSEAHRHADQPPQAADGR